MSVWMKIFEIIRFEIKIIFCEIKKSKDFLLAELTILNVLEWEWVFDKINILTILRNKNNQNSQNERFHTGPHFHERICDFHIT